MRKNKLNVALLVGGISEERKISLQTGESVYTALLELGYSVKVIDPALGKNQHETAGGVFSWLEVSSGRKEFLEAFGNEVFSDIDVVFNAMHGKYGEDGVTQTLLEMMGIPFVGTGALGSTIGMDKWLSKLALMDHGVKVPSGKLINPNNYDLKKLDYWINKFLSVPFIVKSSDQGSTIGLTLCNTTDELVDAINKAAKVSDRILIEKYISGREFTVAIIGDKVLPVLEIIPHNELYDYDAKYKSDETEFIVPANIDSITFKHLQEIAEKSFNAIGCRDYARVDFIVREDGDIYCLEVNTLPGMTSHSLVPKMAKAEGIEFNELIDMLIKFAVNR